MDLKVQTRTPAVTGTSNPGHAIWAPGGVGRNIAETLAREGYLVYAGARKQADIDELSAIDNIEGIRLDVTVQNEVLRILDDLVGTSSLHVGNEANAASVAIERRVKQTLLARQHVFSAQRHCRGIVHGIEHSAGSH